jgi:hypothetical protein
MVLVLMLGCDNPLVQPATLGTKRSSDAELFLSPSQVKLHTGEARLNELLNRRVQLRSGVTHCMSLFGMSLFGMSLFGMSLFAKIPLQFNAQRTFRIQA